MRTAYAALLVMTIAVTTVAQDPPEELFLRIYAVQDLCTGVLEDDRKTKDTAESRARRFKGLLRLIRENLEFESTTFIEGQNGALVVRGTAADHKKLGEFLSDLRESIDTQYLVEFSFVAIDPKKGLPGDAMPLGSGPPDQKEKASAAYIRDVQVITCAYLDEKEARRFKSSGNSLTAPSLITRGLEESVISLGKTRKFVTRYEVVRGVEGHPDGLAVPHIKTIHEGLTVRVYLIPSRDRRYVTMDLDLLLTGLVEPLQSSADPHGVVHDVKTKRQQVKTCFTMQPGATLALSGLQPVHQTASVPPGHEVIALIRVSKLPGPPK